MLLNRRRYMNKEPTKTYIVERFRELNLTRGSFARHVGGRPEKVLRRLEAFLEFFEESDEFLTRVKRAIQADEEIWQEYVERDRERLRLIKEAEIRDIEARDRARFRPHVWVIGARRIPSPIFLVAVCGEGSFRRANLPDDILSYDLENQLTIVRQKFLEFAEERNNSAGPFGQIVGYFYRQKYEYSYEFDLEGNLISEQEGRYPVNAAYLRPR